MKYLLIEAGFPAEGVQTGSWGNRACVKANMLRIPHLQPVVSFTRERARGPYCGLGYGA
jgi:hypothetical protein